MTLDSPGKVNLTLELLGTRADGYHALRSIVLPVSLCETVSVELRCDGQVTLETRFEGVEAADVANLPPARNLAVRAALALREGLGDPSLGADIRLVKRIPVGAGMGGGSADAAGVLRALRVLWRPDLPDAAWFAAGASVGSDVPALQAARPVLMEGRGERVTPLPPLARPVWLVLAFPALTIPTGAVYRDWDAFATPDTGEATDRCLAALRAGSVADLAACLRNGLQPVVDRSHPATKAVREALLAAGARAALLSGSGSTVFGLADDEEHAGRVARAMRGVCRTIVAHSFDEREHA